MLRRAAVAAAAAVASLAAAAAAACSGAAAPPPQAPRVAARPGDLVIADVAVLPMARPDAAPLPHRTVIVRGDRIVAVEPSERVDVPAGATRVDGAGKWLMPGLTDMHVHMWTEHDLTLFVAAGVTTVRSMFGSTQHLAWRNEIARGERLGPTLVAGSPIIDGAPPVWPGSLVLTRPADASRIAGELKAQGYDFLKPYARLSREAYDALVAAGKQHDLPLAGHVPYAAGLRHVLASRQQTIEHLDGWLPALAPAGEQLPPDIDSPAYRAMLPRLELARIPALVQETIAAGTWSCPTLIVTERLAAMDNPAALRARARWLKLVSRPVLAMWDSGLDARLRTWTAEDYKTMREGNALRRGIIAALAAANAPLLVGTDAGNPFVIPGESLHEELELLIAAGVPRARVLHAATAGTAAFLGQRGRAGVVAPGARADLLLLDADPLAGPLPLVPAGVVLRGRWLPRAELEQQLAAVERASAASEAAPASERWDRMPPLAADGPVLFSAHYDIVRKGKTIGEERLVASQVAGGRSLSAQLVSDFVLPVEASYKLGPTGASLSAKIGPSPLSLDGKLERGTFIATGTDMRGRPLSLSAPFPAGAFLSSLGIAGAFNLAERLAGMAAGDRRTLTSVELSFFPRPAIDTFTHDVERKPDAGGLRVYAVKSRSRSLSLETELAVDSRGQVVSRTFGPPFDFAFRRRP